MAIPRVMHVRDKIRNMGPCVPAPEDVYGPGPTPESGQLLYKMGDPMPLAEAQARGYEATSPEVDEPAPRNASVRGRTIRIADRTKPDSDTV